MQMNSFATTHRQTAPSQNLNIIIRIKPKQLLRIYEDMYSQLRILQHRVSTYSRYNLKRINP